MKFVSPRVRLANQNPGAFVSVSYTNQIALFPFVCCFCFVRAFSFQGHTKIALISVIYKKECRQCNIKFTGILCFILGSLVSTLKQV